MASLISVLFDLPERIESSSRSRPALSPLMFHATVAADPARHHRLGQNGRIMRQWRLGEPTPRNRNWGRGFSRARVFAFPDSPPSSGEGA